MKQGVIAVLLVSLASVYSYKCYDRYNFKYYNEGDEFSRNKPMGTSTLLGTYDCRCEAMGRLVCHARDIPCYDVKEKSFVPKYERFNVYYQGDLMECTCMGGRGRFEQCYPVGCKDIVTGEFVTSGLSYTTKRFGVYLKCTCNNGSPARGSCYKVKISETVVDPCIEGASHCSSNAVCRSNGNTFSCRCNAGFQGTGYMCFDIDECNNGLHSCSSHARCVNSVGEYQCICHTGYTGNGKICTPQCVDEINGNYVNDGDTFLRVEGFRKVQCICEQGQPQRGSCEAVEIETTSNQTPRTTQASGCRDELTGKLVPNGEDYTVTRVGYNIQCVCSNGGPLSGSCRRFATVKPVTTTTTPANKCFDRKTKTYYAEGESYEWVRGSRTYRCTCTERRGSMISRCVFG